MTIDLDHLEDLDDELTDHATALHRAEIATRSAENGVYRLPEARDAAIAEAEAARAEAATAARKAAEALDAAVRETRTTLAEVDSVATWADDATTGFRRYWQTEAKEATLADLKQSLRIALRKDSLSKLAVVVQAITRRLGAAPVGTFDHRGYRPAADPDQAVRRDLDQLLGKAKERLALRPDPEVLSRLDELRDAAATVRTSTDPYQPRRTYAFQQDDDYVKPSKTA